MKNMFVGIPFWLLVAIILIMSYNKEWIMAGCASFLLMVLSFLMTKTKSISNFKIDLDDKSLSVNQKESDEPKE